MSIHHLRPTLGQLVDSVLPEGRGLGGEEVGEVLPEVVFVIERLSVEEALEMAEQPVVRRGKVRAVRRIGNDLLVVLFQLGLGDLGRGRCHEGKRSCPAVREWSRGGP